MRFVAAVFQLIFSLEQGSWIESDRLGNSVIIEWYAYQEIDEVIYQIHLEAIPIYARAMAPFQLEQIQAFRQLPAEEQEKNLKYKNYPVDINEENSVSFFESQLFLEYTELIGSSESFCEIQKYFVKIKDANGIFLGFAHFCLKQEQGGFSAELEPLMIDTPAQGRGLSRKLIFSIFKICPEVKRIYLCTNAKNIKARNVYRHLGFQEFSRIQTDDLAWEYGTGIVYEFVK